MVQSKVNPTINIKDASLLWNPDTREFTITHWAHVNYGFYSGLLEPESMREIEQRRKAWLDMDDGERLVRLLADVFGIHQTYGVPMDHMHAELLKIREYNQPLFR